MGLLKLHIFPSTFEPGYNDIYLCSTSICQSFCGTNQFLTVHHNMILIGYNNTCVLRHKIFSPFHDVMIKFDSLQTSCLNRASI